MSEAVNEMLSVLFEGETAEDKQRPVESHRRPTEKEIKQQAIEPLSIDKMDIRAREGGFIVGCSGQVYERQLTRSSFLLLEEIGGLFTLYRQMIRNDKNDEKIFVEGVSFSAALKRAESYLNWRMKAGRTR